MIFTIGYQGLKPAKLKQIVDRLDAMLIDVRSRASSRIPGYNKSDLEKLLGPAHYEHWPQLGGRDNVIPERALHDLWAHYGRATNHCILMCMEKMPFDCHRHNAICGPHFPYALHIVNDEIIAASEVTAYVKSDGAHEYSAYHPSAFNLQDIL